MKRSRSTKFRMALILATVASGLLSGCAADATKAADQCVGPPSYCNVYFGGS
ncbi:outer membrane biogenesis lipoprotein LolB [Paraburkholderia sp. WSM4177]|nr:outer membrane biogenesis lipoprotein LolB [Paraburkholderia sp. WSM4177]MBB5485600.1 outer membrane biogenesis lipoprotein LolB [Paraburkholderia sp. WSM4180]